MKSITDLSLIATYSLFQRYLLIIIYIHIHAHETAIKHHRKSRESEVCVPICCDIYNCMNKRKLSFDTSLAQSRRPIPQPITATSSPFLPPNAIFHSSSDKAL